MKREVEMKHRVERADSFIMEELSLILRSEVQEPGVSDLSVTAVDLTPDRRNARVYVTSYEGEESLQEGLEGVERAKGYIRYRLAQLLSWPFTPEIEFRPDRTWERAQRIESLLEEWHNEDSAEVDEISSED